jgi:hypothetical protein
VALYASSKHATLDIRGGEAARKPTNFQLLHRQTPEMAESLNSLLTAIVGSRPNTPSTPTIVTVQQQAQKTEEREFLKKHFEKLKTQEIQFAYFLHQMRLDGAASLRHYLRSFLADFPKKANSKQKVIQQFINFMSQRIIESNLFQPDSYNQYLDLINHPRIPVSPSSPANQLENQGISRDLELDAAFEGLEKLITSKLYPLLMYPEDTTLDSLINHRIRLHQWVRESHLDLMESDLWGEAEKWARGVDTVKSPRDKLWYMEGCIRVLMHIASIGTEEAVPSADDLLPMLLYTLLRSNPPHLWSSLLFVQRFRDVHKSSQGFEAWLLTTWNSALEWLNGISVRGLTVSEEDYKIFVENSAAAVRSEEASREEEALRTVPAGEFKKEKSVQEIATEAGEVLAKPFLWMGKLLDDLSTPNLVQNRLRAPPPQPVVNASGNEVANQAGGAPPKPPRQSPSLPGTPDRASSFIQNLTEEERRVYEDFELQLALALSLSEESEKEKDLIDFGKEV